MSNRPGRTSREVTVNDLYAAGYARSFTGYWLRPNGLSVVDEHDALREVAELLDPEAARSDDRREPA